jgi:GTP-dependent phosphoenolpyruvate carboxykinase
MGPLGSPLSKVGIELTDSIYVVLSMRIMARMGNIAYEHLGASTDFNRGVHTMLDLDPQRRFIAHFPQDNAIISVDRTTAATSCLGKNASHCASARTSAQRRMARRAHAHHRGRGAIRGKERSSRRLSRARAAKRTSR